MRGHRSLRLLLGLALLGALLAWFDPRAVSGALARLPAGALALAGAAILASTLLGAVNLHLLIGRQGRIGLRAFLPIYWFGWALGLVVPGQVGDLGGIAAGLRRHDFDWHHSLGPALLDKLLSLAVIAALGAAGAATALGAGPAGWAAPFLAVAVALPAGLWLRRAAQLRRDGTGPLAVAARSLAELEATVRGHPARVLVNAALSVAKAGLLGLAYLAMFRGLGYADADWLPITALMAACSLVAYVPVSLNGLGTTEAAGVLLFGTRGIAAADVIASYLALRVLVLALAWLPVALWWLARPAAPRAGSRDE